MLKSKEHICCFEITLLWFPCPKFKPFILFYAGEASWTMWENWAKCPLADACFVDMKKERISSTKDLESSYNHEHSHHSCVKKHAISKKEIYIIKLQINAQLIPGWRLAAADPIRRNTGPGYGMSMPTSQKKTTAKFVFFQSSTYFRLDNYYLLPVNSHCNEK